MRWFTCTPIAFGGGQDFFARDSGLLSRGFQSIGVDSRAVMPGKWREEDEPDLIRTDAANLRSPKWWKSLGLDGVVLYAWGRPRYLPVALAIRRAGIFLVLNQDSGGIVSPLNGLKPWFKEQRIVTGGGAPYLKQAIYGLTVGLFVSDPLRAVHLNQGDVIACVSPVAAEGYHKLCKIYGGRGLADRVATLPHPVDPRFDYQGETKQPTVVAIGRWDAVLQKRPSLLMQVISTLTRSDPEVKVEVVGTVTAELAKWHGALAPECRTRVSLHGRLLPAVISRLLARAQILYCPSAFESFHIASGEALCSGCSIVAADSLSLSSFAWFCGEDSGALSERDDATGHVQTLEAELARWSAGQRIPSNISGLWKSRLHAPAVAGQVLALSRR